VTGRNDAGRVEIVIDTDPGIDDAFAILYCLGNPGIRVSALTTTAGNAPLGVVTRNAQYLLRVSSHEDIPLGMGLSGRHADEVERAFSSHGGDGLGGAVPENFRPDEPVGRAVAVLREAVRRAERPITVLAIGPMTNMAAFRRAYPDDYQRIDRIVAMGGAFGGSGNVTPTAEFNAWADPESLAEVLEGPVDVLMIPLEVTQQATLETAALDALPESPVAHLLQVILAHYAGVHVDQFGSAATQQHDAVAAIAIGDPDTVKTVRGRISVDVSGPHRGTTSFTRARDGRHQIATSHSQLLFEQELLRGLTAAARPTSSM
jgi:pyrimidine-specific ribonucleoside hydrolase